MFTRYKNDKKGNRVPVAKVYTSKEHNVRNSHIDKDALWTIRRIQASGEQAYIVGGAVRDLLLGKTPKDFDIATSASPRQIQRLFWNSRVIGKRFRIVHIFFGDKIIEVTTFRSDEENFEEGNNNIFGTIEQDSKRRDFSINALYYNPADGHLVDFNDSLDDFRKQVIRSLIPLKYSFSEDPVRMIRAIKYTCTTGFHFKWDVKFALYRDASNIQAASTSRLTDEMTKIFSSGYSYVILKNLMKYRLLGYMMPCLAQYMSLKPLAASLSELDEMVKSAKRGDADMPSPSLMLYHLVKPLILPPEAALTIDEKRKEVFRQIKILISPMTPPNYEIERTVEMILSDLGIRTSSRRKSKKGPSNKKAVLNKSTTAKRKKRKSGAPIPKVAEKLEEAISSAEAHDI